MRRVVLLIAVVTGMAALSGCSAFRSSQPNSYTEALQVCRFKANGNHPRRTPLPATNPRVESCLARAGWSPDGTRLPNAPAQSSK